MHPLYLCIPPHLPVEIYKSSRIQTDVHIAIIRDRLNERDVKLNTGCLILSARYI